MEQKLKKIKPMVRLSQSQIDSKKEFIRQYIEAENASSGSTVDSNANVSVKTVATLGAELNKDICIQINRSTMCDYIEKYFDRETAEDYVKLLEEHTIYKHDETSPAPYYPYTYSPDEVVFVVYKEEPHIISFKNLYDLCSEEEILLDEEKGVWGKYPEDMKIADKESFTKVERLIKKNRHRDMVYVRTDCGEDLLVTDNHPLIVNDNIEDTVEAKDSLSKKQYSCSINYDAKQKEYIDSSSFLETYDDVFTNYYSIKVNNLWTFFPKSVKFSSDLGYFIGFFIGDGHYIKDKYLVITQKDKSVLTHLGDILYRELGIPSSIVKKDTGNCYNLRICSKPLVTMFRDYFKIGKYSVNKTIPSNILSFSDEFIDGIISGLIDSDGTLNTNNTALIRVCSRSLVEQLAVLFRIKKVAFHVRRQKVTKSKTGYSSKYDIYCIYFDCKKFTKYEKTPYTHNSRYNENWNILDTGTDVWKDIVSVDYDLSKKYLEEMDYIYDITTSTHTFICNGLLVHNCVAINMYPFLEHGMTKLGGESTAPKHLESYCGSLINLIFAISSQFAGAVATAEALLYFHYFAQKDYGKDYLKTHPEMIKAKLQHVV